MKNDKKLRGVGVKIINAVRNTCSYAPKPGGKLDMTLLTGTMRKGIVEALTPGAIKYGLFNWRVKPNSHRQLIAAAERHIDAFMEGEDLDPETGVHHIKHAAASLCIVIDQLGYHPADIDDRPISND